MQSFFSLNCLFWYLDREYDPTIFAIEWPILSIEAKQKQLYIFSFTFQYLSNMASKWLSWVGLILKMIIKQWMQWVFWHLHGPISSSFWDHQHEFLSWNNQNVSFVKSTSESSFFLKQCAFNLLVFRDFKWMIARWTIRIFTRLYSIWTFSNFQNCPPQFYGKF